MSTTGKFTLDADGNAKPESDLMVWARWFETADRHLAVKMIGEVKVSTVFLGMDHNFDETGPPLLWETMVFGGPLDQEQRQYTTREQAVAGHYEVVCAVIAAQAAQTRKPS